MGLMNMARAGHGNSTENPFDAIGKAISGLAEFMKLGLLPFFVEANRVN